MNNPSQVEHIRQRVFADFAFEQQDLIEEYVSEVIRFSAGMSTKDQLTVWRSIQQVFREAKQNVQRTELLLFDETKVIVFNALIEEVNKTLINYLVDKYDEIVDETYREADLEIDLESKLETQVEAEPEDSTHIEAEELSEMMVFQVLNELITELSPNFIDCLLDSIIEYLQLSQAMPKRILVH